MSTRFYLVILFIIFVMVSCKYNVLEDPINQEPFTYAIPDHIQLVTPAGLTQTWTYEGVALGKQLFYDPILSADSTQSCSSCHLQAYNFVDTAKFSKGILGLFGKRNSMPIFNMLWNRTYFWDGRANTLNQQALMPIQDHLEMNNSIDVVISKLEGTTYKTKFRQLFGPKGLNTSNLAEVLAQFMFSITSFNTKWDSVQMGLATFSIAEKKGEELFFGETGVPGKKGADCFHCHLPPFFMNNSFNNNGLDSTFNDKGHFNVTGNASDLGAFKTPTLRNLSYTAPYMHDGRFNTLEEVLNHYNLNVKNSPTLDPGMSGMLNGLQLTSEDQDNIIQFLKTLNDHTLKTEEKHKNPFNK